MTYQISERETNKIHAIIANFSKRYVSREEHEDFFQSAWCDLLSKVETYDPSRSLFLTFATKKIKWFVFRYQSQKLFRKTGIKIPERVLKEFSAIDTPVVSDEYKGDTIDSLFDYRSLQDYMKDRVQNQRDISLKNLVDYLLSMLTPREKRIINRVFYKGETLKRVSQQYRCSYSAIRTEYYRAINKLRRVNL